MSPLCGLESCGINSGDFVELGLGLSADFGVNDSRRVETELMFNSNDSFEVFTVGLCLFISGLVDGSVLAVDASVEDGFSVKGLFGDSSTLSAVGVSVVGELRFGLKDGSRMTLLSKINIIKAHFH